MANINIFLFYSLLNVDGIEANFLENLIDQFVYEHFTPCNHQDAATGIVYERKERTFSRSQAPG
jgi:hypothetical protein